jgi:hypothetical protein
VIIYENIDSWMLRELIQSNEKGKVRIIFDELEQGCYEMLLD